MEDNLVEYGFRRVIITVTAILCALLEIVDTTIVNVALNDMKGSLGVTLTDVAWVITAYAIANVIVVPMSSWLSQQFGRRNYFAASIIIFTVSSFLCGNASTITELIIFRFMQGLGGGALLVTAQTIITESYPKEKRGMAQAIYGMGIIVGPTLGPPLGGYLVDNYSWPYIFYINIPIGILATILTFIFIKSPKYSSKLSVKQVDFIGIALLSVAVGSLQFVLEHGQQDDWFNNTNILILSILAVVGFFFFIWREIVAEHPIVNLKVLKNNNLAVGTIMSFILGFGLYGSTFIIPIYLQSILGWTATQAGMLLIPSSIATAFMMPLIGMLLQKGVSPKYLVASGFFLFFIYCQWSYRILTSDTGSEHFVWPLVLRGAGMGLLFIPITTLSLSGLQGREIGDGAAFTGMMRQLGGSFGIAIITTLISMWNVHHRSDLVSQMPVFSQELQNRIAGLTQMFIGKGYSSDEALNKSYQLLDFGVSKQAALLAYMDVFLVLGNLFLACIPFILLIKKGAGKITVATDVH